MMYRLAATALVLISVGVSGFASKAYAENPQPETVVEAFHKTLIRAMQLSSFDDRVALLGPVIDTHFVVATTARISLGRQTWNTLTDEETSSYQNALRDLIVTTYAARFDNFNEQSFETEDAKPIGKNRYRVDTKLNTKSEIVDLVYQLQNVDGHWQIYDVVAKGVSDLSQKRSNYTVMYQSGGLAAVLDNIHKETGENRTTSEDNR